MPAMITAERPDTPDAIKLIEELETELAGKYPGESRYGYSVEKLLKQNVAFFVTRLNGVAAGCGGVQLFRREYGELKRMFVSPFFRGKGLAKLMLEHLASYTKENGVRLLRLEIGIYQRDAIALYEKWGFKRISAVGEYKEDPLSIFYAKKIE